MSTHHPDEILLLEYSAGSLSEPQALCIRLHLDRCSLCRSQLEIMDYLGSAMLEDQHQHVELSEDLFDRINSSLDKESAASSSRHESKKDTAGLLRGLIEGRIDYEALPWTRQLGDISAYDISDCFGTATRERVILQRLKPGGHAPTHTHHGRETTVVLQGAFCDDSGIFEAGDFVVLDSTHEHKPVAMGAAPCVGLTVLTAPVKLTGLFSRMLNPFIR